MTLRSHSRYIATRNAILRCSAIVISLLLSFSAPPAVAAQEIASDSITTNLYEPSEKFNFKQLIAPVSLIALGACGINNNWFTGNKYTTQDLNIDNWHRRKFRGDDYIQYLPIATAAVLNFTNLGRHPKRERWVMTATACAITAILTNSIKWAVNERRPDSSASNSFPSGHTATAFMGAELVRIEYGNAWGIGAYTVACAVGALRMYNNRHWFNDVLAGAGIGILSARAALWLLPLERKLFRWDKLSSVSNVAIVPLATTRNVGLALTAQF